MVSNPRKLLGRNPTDNVRVVSTSTSFRYITAPPRLNPSTGLASGGVSAIATRSVNDRAVEASTIYKHGNFYYLFTSWDKCCSGTSSTYNIRVGRSSRLDFAVLSMMSD